MSLDSLPSLDSLLSLDFTIFIISRLSTIPKLSSLPDVQTSRQTLEPNPGTKPKTKTKTTNYRNPLQTAQTSRMDGWIDKVEREEEIN